MEVMAEGVGFEPTEPFGSTVFKTAAIGHSAIPPSAQQRWPGRLHSGSFSRKHQDAAIAKPGIP